MYPFAERGRPLGWLFGAMAGGMAFGSPLGAILIPVIGWRGLFLIVAAAGACTLLVLVSLFPYQIDNRAAPPRSSSLVDLLQGYKVLLQCARGQRTYGYVFVNSLFHSGLFAWIGVYFEQRYRLGSVGIGLALLGYGVPGFLLGPTIGRIADRWGRARLLPIGLMLSALAALLLMIGFPVILAPMVMMVLSLGYDLTQPLLGGIVTSLGSKRPGQAMGLNVFILFVGFGVGSLLFGQALRSGFNIALSIFFGVELIAALASVYLFRAELPPGGADGNAAPV
jgi:predicted MFS family arabinose efflux permease